MKIRAFAAAAALVLASAGSALAADRVVVTLEQPVAAKTKVIAGGAVFSCEGSSCIASAALARTSGYRACKELAKEVGRVAAYNGKTALDADDLGRCNGGAAPLAGSQQAAK